nr:ribonuclease H-like domain-containing protein [Tanacetum cinerariifolium]
FVIIYVHNSEHNTPNNSDHDDDDIHDSVTRISKLDISDPLHLHPNDTTAFTIVSIKLKGNKKLSSMVMCYAFGFRRETLPNVRSVYATNSSEESHKVAVGSIAGASQRNQASAFVSNVPYSQIFQRRANQHITYTDKELDNVINISHLKIKVGHPNGTKAYISKMENLRSSNGLTLYDVMVIPEYYVTLIFVHKLIKENKRVANDLNKYKSDSSSSSESGSSINTVDFLVYYGNDAHSSNDLLPLRMRRLSNLKNFIFKGPSGETDRYKARLVAQGFGQNEGIDYEETFSPVVKIVTVRCLLNIVVSMSWPVFQLDAPRQWNAKLTSTLIENVFSQSKSDYSLYTKSDKGVFLALFVYVDDIIITSNSVYEIEKFKVFLKSKFMIKDLGKLKYFLGIKVVDTDKASDKDPLIENITDYQKLMEKLIYLTNTRPDISYVVYCLSQFMHSLLTSHLKIAFKILRYLKSCPSLEVHVIKTSGMFLTAYFDADWAKCIVTRKSVTGYCMFLNNSLVFWKNLKIENLFPVSLHCDSNSAIKIAANLVFYERTKHLEIDLHSVREKVLKGVVKTVKVDSANQIADILIKGWIQFSI